MRITLQRFGVHLMNYLMLLVVDLKEDYALSYVIMLVGMNPVKNI